MDTTSIDGLMQALAIWSGQAQVGWLADTFGAVHALTDPWVESSPMIGAHTAALDALTHWGMAAGASVVAAIYFLPRLLTDR